MPINLMVLKNHFAACKDQYYVRSSSPMKTMELEDFITIMSRGHTTLTRTELSGAMALYKEELLGLLSQGMAVKTPTGTFSFGAAGSLEAVDTPFLPGSSANNHRIRLRHRSDRAFENAAKLELGVERDERPDFSIPVLNTVSLAGEAQAGLPLRVSDTAEIKGIRLRFDVADQSQGLFFIDQAGVETRASRYPLILPATVHAVVPAGLAAGIYKVKFRAAVNGIDVTEGALKEVVTIEV